MPKPLAVLGNHSGEVSLLYHPGQQAFLEALERRTPGGNRAYDRLALVAGRRSGKTRVGAIAAVREASKPKTLGWACAPSYPELHDYVLPAIRDALPADWIVKWSAEFSEFTLINGSTIALRSLDEPDRGRGPGLHWLWLDEACKMPEQSWNVVAPALTDKPGIAWVTTTPNGYDWVYRRFWRPAIDGVAGQWAIRFTTADNPQIQARELDRAKAEHDEKWYRQEFLADFVNFTGAIFDSDLLGPQIVPAGSESLVIPEWPLIDTRRPALMGIDPGTDHPFAAVLAVLTEQGLVLTGDYLERHRPIADHVTELQRMTQGLTDVRYVYDRTARQIALELAQHGIFAQPSDSSVEGGIRRIESWLKTKKLWLLESRVPRTITQMQTLRWAENYDRFGQKRGQERIFKVDDDLPDALRYLVMAWPELPETTTAVSGRDPRTVPEESRWAWEREQRIAKWEPAVETGVGDFW